MLSQYQGGGGFMSGSDVVYDGGTLFVLLDSIVALCICTLASWESRTS